MTEKKFPLNFEGIVKLLIVSHGFPSFHKNRWAGRHPDSIQAMYFQQWTAYGTWSPNHSRAFTSIHLHDKKIIPANPHRPSSVELAKNAIIQLHSGIAGIICGAFVPSWPCSSILSATCVARPKLI